MRRPRVGKACLLATRLPPPLVPPQVRESGWLPERHGVYISRWHHGSPAHRYGLYALHFVTGGCACVGRCRAAVLAHCAAQAQPCAHNRELAFPVPPCPHARGEWHAHA